jgi:DNA topoisomerase 2-associated protein PAT1
MVMRMFFTVSERRTKLTKYCYISLDFEDTYDGLGDQLEESGDTFNDDTFGSGGNGASQSVGKDFDFFGSTAKVSEAINEDQMLYSREQKPAASLQAIAQSPTPAPARPRKTGYETYGQIGDLQANESLWGVAPKKPTPYLPPQQSQQPSRKYMSVEEVEAAMRAQNQKQEASQPPQQQVINPALYGAPQQHQHQQQQQQQQHYQTPPPQQFQQVPPPQVQPQFQQQFQQPPPPQGPRNAQPPQILQREQQTQQQGHQPGGRHQGSHHQQQRSQHHATQQTGPKGSQRASSHPKQILQNPNRRSQQTEDASEPQQGLPQGPQQGQPRPVSGQMPLVTHPQQLMNLTDEEKAAFLIEDAKRAKRNHKIHILSQGNGLMTPQDKNFITRIQLQQLITATGNPNEPSPDAALSDDFYYTVHSQIRGGPRSNPNQPLNHFAQTYLFQTGGPGPNRRQHRGGDNHMQRMAQQVQRAVMAAKARPKNSQLVLEGSLGKISFSNAKTPKPLLNLKRTESGETNRPPSAGLDRKPHAVSAGDRKSILRSIENVYDVLLKMEMHERQMPPPPQGPDDKSGIEAANAWGEAMEALNQKMWIETKIMEPVNFDSKTPHPFIAFLSVSKGKTAIPRIFRHIDQEKRMTVLTMIVAHLGVLDVVRLALLQPGEVQLPSAVRKDIDLFQQTVMQSLFLYVNEAPLGIVIGLLGVILDRVDISIVARTKIGLAFLTMFVSRAELIKQSGDASEGDLKQWDNMYNRLFDAFEPTYRFIFPPSVNSADDMYVWQFLAAIGIGAGAQQQQRLVIAVK